MMIKRVFFSILLIVALIVDIYSVRFVFLPDILTGKRLMGIIGFFVFLFDINKIRLNVLNKYGRIIFWSIVYFIWCVICCIINGTGAYDVAFNSMFSVIMHFFISYLIFRIATSSIVKNADNVIDIIIVAIVVENVLAVLMRYSYGLLSFMNSILLRDGLIQISVDELNGYYRIVGIGNAFYFSVIFSCYLGLLLSAFQFIKKKQAKYLCVIALVGIVSFLTTRWSITVVFLSLIMIIINSLREKKYKQILFFLLFIYAGWVIINMIATRIYDNQMVEWAFELLRNYNEYGHYESGTTNALLEWWRSADFSVKTLLFGDGLWITNTFSGVLYYKETDVGFIRVINYCGIFGLFLLFFYHIQVLREIYKIEKSFEMRLLTISMFLTMVLGMLKGYLELVQTDILVLVMLDFVKNNSINPSFEQKIIS